VNTLLVEYLPRDLALRRFTEVLERTSRIAGPALPPAEPFVARSELVDEWRARASTLQAYAPPAAEAFRRAADELEASLRGAANERLTLETASEESGYSKRRLREMIAEGRIPNAGRLGAPLLRRADLPKKAQPTKPTVSTYDPAVHAAEIMERMRRF
jgi:hypothetical protein